MELSWRIALCERCVLHACTSRRRFNEATMKDSTSCVMADPGLQRRCLAAKMHVLSVNI